MHSTQLMIFIQCQLTLFLTLFPAFLNAPPVHLSFGFSNTTSDSPPKFVAFVLFCLIVGPLFSLSLFTVKLISRKFEFEADRFTAGLEGRVPSTPQDLKLTEGTSDDIPMGEKLARVLVSSYVKNKSPVWVDWM